MIARIWHGATPAAKADAYYEYLEASGVKEYRRTKGNRGVYVFRKVTSARADFVLVSLWDSYESIRAFAGEDIEKARYFPKDREFLLEFEPGVSHYDVLSAP
jgi:heme-degrading monooxygenase HmoA